MVPSYLNLFYEYTSTISVYLWLSMARMETEYSLKKIGPTFSKLSFCVVLKWPKTGHVYLASFGRKIVTNLIQLIGSTRFKFDVWPNRPS